MSSSTLGLLELLLVFGAVLGFGIYELISLKRAKRSREAARRATQEPTRKQ